MAFIYKTTNLLNNKIYIGKTKKNNLGYLGSGLKLNKAILKHGRENFKRDIIEECEDNMLNEREVFWISFYDSTNDIIGYNISRGGDGGSHYWDTLSAEERQQHNTKISIAKRGRSRGPHKNSTKEKMSASFNKSPEVIEKRANSKRAVYTCINHITNSIFVTKNLADFCLNHELRYNQMTACARNKRSFVQCTWSCRVGDLSNIENIIDDIKNETENNIINHENENRVRLKQNQPDRSGKNNPMYGKKHKPETIEKIKRSYENRKDNN